MSVNFKPIFGALALTYNSKVAAAPNLDGLTIATPSYPWFDLSSPSMVDFQSAMKSYAPGVEVNGSPLIGFAAGRLFELAAQHVPDPPTTASLLEGLWNIKDNDLGGIVMPLTFTRDTPPPNRYCFWSVQVKGGKPTTPVGAERHCEDGTR